MLSGKLSPTGSKIGIWQKAIKMKDKEIAFYVNQLTQLKKENEKNKQKANSINHGGKAYDDLLIERGFLKERNKEL